MAWRVHAAQGWRVSYEVNISFSKTHFHNPTMGFCHGDSGKINLLSGNVAKEQSQQRGHKTGSIREGCKHPSLATKLTSFLTSLGLLAVSELITTAAHMAQQLICLTDGQTEWSGNRILAKYTVHVLPATRADDFSSINFSLYQFLP